MSFQRIWGRASKYVLDLPFLCDTKYEEWLLTAKLLPLSYWHEYLGIVFFYNANHGMNILNKNTLRTPQHHRQTRSSDSKYIMQIRKSYTIRTTTWSLTNQQSSCFYIDTSYQTCIVIRRIFLFSNCTSIGAAVIGTSCYTVK